MSSTTAPPSVSATATGAVVVLLLSLTGSPSRAASPDAKPSPVAPKKALVNDSGQNIARYSKILAKNTDNATALMGRAKAYVSRRDYALALADYDRAVLIAPQSNAAQYERAALRLLMQKQSALLLAAKPTQTSSAPVLDGSQFDDDGTIRAHVAPPVPTLARN